VAAPLVEYFKQTDADNVADFCLQMYQRMGLLDRVQLTRSGDPRVRERAVDVADYFIDVRHEGELVRARLSDDCLLLHKGGKNYIKLPLEEHEKIQISPTRDTRLRWMQSVVRCTHYVCGAGEGRYLKTSDASDVQFITRDEISESDCAYVPEI
jgi:hypothetical protein